MAIALFISVFVVATCGLVYELIAGTIASYLLGDSVMQFSTVIGVYLSAMGVGSYLTKFIRRGLLAFFIKTEILVGLVGGFSGALLFLLFQYVNSFRVVLYLLIAIIGMLVGIEIPLILRIMKDRVEFKDLISRVFALDYIGALFASILFPLILVPHLGLVRSSFLFGIINCIVAVWLLLLLRHEIVWRKMLLGFATIAIAVMTIGFAYSEKITSMAETAQFADTIIFAKSTPHQRVVITNSEDGLRLFLNGNLQFSTKDEYRYHEALVHVGLANARTRRNILVLGGGDGLAVREILKYQDVGSITLIDLDKEITQLFAQHPKLRTLNQDALNDPRVQVINADAYTWLREHTQTRFDFVIVDFPDPSNYSVGKLFTTNFYQLLVRSLSDEGAMVVQASSPYYARKSFWCIVHTLEAVGLSAYPYHAYVPSFGEWGFVLASKSTWVPATKYPDNLSFVTPETVKSMFAFAKDMQRLPTEINRLSNQALVRYFDEEWQDLVL